MAGSLLERGYRPVPLYNSCPPPEPASHVSFFSSLSSEGAPSAGPPAVDVQPILRAPAGRCPADPPCPPDKCPVASGATPPPCRPASLPARCQPPNGKVGGAS